MDDTIRSEEIDEGPSVLPTPPGGPSSTLPDPRVNLLNTPLSVNIRLWFHKGIRIRDHTRTTIHSWFTVES